MFAYTYFPQPNDSYPLMLLFDWFKGRKSPDSNPKEEFIHPGLIGKTGYTVIDIKPGFFLGRVMIDGVEYPACCDIKQSRTILTNTRVKVTGIKMRWLKVRVY